METTGTPQNYNAPITDLDNWPRMVQLAWIFFNENDDELDRREMIIKPQGFKIPKEATKIHGITTEEAMKNGIQLNEALNDFSSILHKSKILIAHNVEFDEKIVGAEFIRENLSNNIQELRKVCTMKQSTNFCKMPGKYGKYKWPTLSELYYILFETQFEDAHDAEQDVEACAKCFFELKRKGVIKI